MVHALECISKKTDLVYVFLPPPPPYISPLYTMLIILLVLSVGSNERTYFVTILIINL